MCVTVRDRVAGVVPEPAGEVAQDGEHEEGPGPAGAQPAAADVQRPADLCRGDRATRPRARREETSQAAGARQSPGGAAHGDGGGEWRGGGRADVTQQRREQLLRADGALRHPSAAGEVRTRQLVQHREPAAYAEGTARPPTELQIPARAGEQVEEPVLLRHGAVLPHHAAGRLPSGAPARL